ncbi:MAG: hypothetical protein AAB861_00495, partial [Patescibacteria group bacterium]
LMGSMGLGTTTPGAKIGVKGAGIFDGFVSADYFTSTSTNTSWIMGQMGFGTTTPGAKMGVRGAIIADGFVSGDYFTSTSTNTNWFNGALGLGTTTPGARLGVKGAGLYEGFVSADYFTSTSTNSSWLMGNLGIGTTTPGTMLAVDGDGLISGNFYATGTSTTSSLIATSTLEVRGTTGRDFWVGNGMVGLGSTTPSSTLTISNDSSNSTKNLIDVVNSVGTYNFVVTNGGSVGIGMYNPAGYLNVYGNTYLAVTEGNVGIGTTAPVQKLQIEGGAYITSNVGIGTSTPARLLQLASTGSAQLMLTDTDATADLKHWYASSTDGNLSFGTADDR